jgi:hypothetical protein
VSRFVDYFLHLADFRLDFTGDLFANAFAFEAGVVRELADLCLNLAFYLVNLACDLILGSLRHLFPFLERFVFGHSAEPLGFAART